MNLITIWRKLTGTEEAWKAKEEQIRLEKEELTRLREEARLVEESALAVKARLKEEDLAEKSRIEKRDAVPWADICYIDGKMQVNSFNARFVEDLKQKMGDLTDGLNDDEIVKLFTDRENIELEDPKLEVIHSGIDEDGRIKMMLDWNPSFIRHLAENGIQAETEEEAIQIYLSLLTRQVAEDITPEMLSKEDVDAVFHDLDQEARAELEEAARQIEERAEEIKKAAKKPRRRKSSKSV